MSSKQEIEDLQAEFQRDREDITDTIRDLTRQLKLVIYLYTYLFFITWISISKSFILQKMLIISRFIPPEDLADIERCAEWDDESNDWTVASAHLAGNNVRPKDEYPIITTYFADLPY